jgi:hypothetical protein
MQWTVLDDSGHRHKVGLYHGNKSGHLMVYCNMRVLLIDFNVLNTKKYSFFINDELCDLHIQRTNGRFAYGLEIDRKTNTPKNLKLKEIERANTTKAVAILFGVILVVSVVAFFLF